MFKVRKINWKGVGWVGRLREMAFLPACVVHLCNTLCSVWEQTGVSVGEIIMTKTNRVAAILLLSAFSHILCALSTTVSFYECSLPQFHSMSALYHGFILCKLSITVSFYDCSLLQFHSMSALYHSFILWVLSTTVSFYECSLSWFHSMSALYYGFHRWTTAREGSLNKTNRQSNIKWVLLARNYSLLHLAIQSTYTRV